MPAADNKLSVFYTEKMNRLHIWQLADQHINPVTPIKFRTDISVNKVKHVGLDVVLNDTPKYHANIVGWPEGKDDIKLRAQELASLATLCSRSVPS